MDKKEELYAILKSSKFHPAVKDIILDDPLMLQLLLVPEVTRIAINPNGSEAQLRKMLTGLRSQMLEHMRDNAPKDEYAKLMEFVGRLAVEPRRVNIQTAAFRMKLILNMLAETEEDKGEAAEACEMIDTFIANAKFY